MRDGVKLESATVGDAKVEVNGLNITVTIPFAKKTSEVGNVIAEFNKDVTLEEVLVGEDDSDKTGTFTGKFGTKTDNKAFQGKVNQTWEALIAYGSTAKVTVKADDKTTTYNVALVIEPEIVLSFKLNEIQEDGATEPTLGLFAISITAENVRNKFGEISIDTVLNINIKDSDYDLVKNDTETGWKISKEKKIVAEKLSDVLNGVVTIKK